MEPEVNKIMIIITSQFPEASFIYFYGQKMHFAGTSGKNFPKYFVFLSIAKQRSINTQKGYGNSSN